MRVLLAAELPPVGADLRANVVREWPHERRQKAARTLRALAQQAWEQAAAEAGPMPPELSGDGLLFRLNVHRYARRVGHIDADAFAWAGKYILDGAVAAGVLRDDRQVAEVRLIRPRAVKLVASTQQRWVFHAALGMPQA